MNKAAKAYVRVIDKTSRIVGKFAMSLVLGMIAILLYETISRTIFNRPHIWAVEMTQFVMAAYYLLGGGYVLLLDGHVRMDLLYHRWTTKQKALADVITFFIIFIYMVVLSYGAVQGILYAVKYKQVSYSAWSPSVVPIKIIMTLGIFMMFLQVISELIKDIAVARGESIEIVRAEDRK
ncbi:MAG: TRAP transporter small permease subunit [Spirochaetia bacterium]|jgi:TRAP-type mannitol/chloroaromatic compound transport system permease small subunit|nr:TRAP transporter small permease subunit [Spirochaetia bacterium]